jgi:hypothetical protein
MKPKQTTKSDCHHQDRAILLTRSDAKHLASQHTTGSPRSQTRISPSRTRNGYSLQVTPIPCSPRTGATSRFHFTSGSRCGYGHTDGVLYDTHRLLKRVHLFPTETSRKPRFSWYSKESFCAHHAQKARALSLQALAAHSVWV